MRAFTFSLTLLAVLSLSAQKVQLDFVALPKASVSVLYQTIAGLDSIRVQLNDKGQGSFQIQTPAYKGLIQIGGPDIGGVEVIYASNENMKLQSESAMLNAQNVQLLNSVENESLKETQSALVLSSQRLQWATGGKQFYQKDELLFTLLEAEEEKAGKKLKEIDQQMNETELFYADYIRLQLLAQRLEMAIRNPDVKLIEYVQNEVEQKLDVAKLANCLSLHESFFFNYLKMHTVLTDPQTVYAESIVQTIARLKTPYREYYLKNSLFACEGIGWTGVQDAILRSALNNYPALEQTQDKGLERIIAAYKVRQGDIVLNLSGLEKTDKKYVSTLAFFFESDCDMCESEIGELKKNYKLLEEKGIRLVSISSDIDKSIYERTADSFPWQDKLCDLKGFEGPNFKNFAVIGTPTFYLLVDNKVQERYTTLADLLSTVN